MNEKEQVKTDEEAKVTEMRDEDLEAVAAGAAKPYYYKPYYYGPYRRGYGGGYRRGGY
jgi:hypothetical protein